MSKYAITTGIQNTPVKTVLYGPEGIGKSSFAAQFPQPVFIDTEGGTKRLNVARLPAPTSWAMLLDEVEEVRKGNVPCRTLVIDTADWAERLCTEAVCAKAKVKGIEDFGYGKGYTYLKEEFSRLLDALEEVLNTGRHVVVLAHAAITKFEQPDAVGNYDRWTMKTSKQVAPLLREWCDMLLFANYKTIVEKSGSGQNAKNKASGARRVLYTAHHACWDAKNRFGLPEEVPFEYASIAACIEAGSAPAAPAATPVPAPAQQPVPAPAHAPQPVPAAATWAPGGGVMVEDAAPAESPQRQVERQQNTAKERIEKELIAEQVPEKLRTLMLNDLVDSATLRHAVFQRGCYPENTPISNYDPQFVAGSLVASWGKCFRVHRRKFRYSVLILKGNIYVLRNCCCKRPRLWLGR